MSGTTRSSAGLDERRRRLLFRAWRRGTHELDLLIGPFADARLETLSEPELDELERLMEVPDQELYGWITGSIAVPRQGDTEIFRALCAFHATKPTAAT